MAYDLMAKSAGLAEPDRFQLLNQYFFQDKGFQIIDLPDQDYHSDHLLIRSVLQTRQGAALIIALLYLHFASHLDLPAQLIQLRRHFLLKWVRSGRSCYVDLTGQGHILAEEQLVDIVSRHRDAESPPNDPLAVLPQRKLFLKYAEDLIQIFERESDLNRLLLMYNAVLKVEPTNIRILGARAILRLKMGDFKEALTDFKRLFSFVEKCKAPIEIQSAHNELLARMASHRVGTQGILH